MVGAQAAPVMLPWDRLAYSWQGEPFQPRGAALTMEWPSWPYRPGTRPPQLPSPTGPHPHPHTPARPPWDMQPEDAHTVAPLLSSVSRSESRAGWHPQRLASGVGSKERDKAKRRDPHTQEVGNLDHHRASGMQVSCPWGFMMQVR